MHNKIVSNASWIIACKILQAIIGLVISMLTARYLGPSNFGLINYAASITTFFTPIMQLGLTNIFVQEIVNYPDEEGSIVGTATLMSFSSSLVCVFGIFVFTSFANASEKITIIVCVLYSLSLVVQSIELVQYWFQAKYLSKYTAISALAAYCIIGLYQILLLISKKPVQWFAITYSIQYGIIAVALLIMYRKLGGPKFHISTPVAKRMFNKGKHYILSTLMVTIFAQTDRIMIKMMLGDEQTGYYSAAVVCAGLTSFVFQAIVDSARPAIFESKKYDNNAFELNITRLYSVVIYLSILQCLGMTLFSKLIITVLYGANYWPSISALRIVVWYTTFSYLGIVRNVWILAEQKQKYLWIINLSGAITNVLLNAVLISPLGIQGAAIASLITQFFTNVIVGYIIQPIRYNNVLMAKGINVKVLQELITKLRN